MTAPWHRRYTRPAAAEPVLDPTPERRVMPTLSLLQGGEYVPAASTDIRARFAALRAAQQQAKPANVAPLRKQGKA